tara:strand:- start:162 stop:422 length:261 start_codon:yes stop_codon:yes gene_type:complete
MDINQLTEIVKKKITDALNLEDIKIEDKTFLHKNHSSHQKDRFHIKISIKSKELKKMNKIEASKKIYKILDIELKKFIHSIQIALE